MQPVQDLTVEDRVSRTQYQYAIQAADQRELSEWAGRLADRMRRLPELRDVAMDQQNQGLQASLVIDRDAASAVRDHAAAHRRHALRRLRPAAGLDDLHPAEPVPRDPRGGARVPGQSGGAQADLREVADRRPGAAERLHALRAGHRAAGHQPLRSVSGGDALLQPGPRRLAGPRRAAPSRSSSARSGCRRRCEPASRGRRRRSRPRWPTSRS